MSAATVELVVEDAIALARTLLRREGTVASEAGADAAKVGAKTDVVAGAEVVAAPTTTASVAGANLSQFEQSLAAMPARTAAVPDAAAAVPQQVSSGGRYSGFTPDGTGGGTLKLPQAVHEPEGLSQGPQPTMAPETGGAGGSMGGRVYTAAEITAAEAGLRTEMQALYESQAPLRAAQARALQTKTEDLVRENSFHPEGGAARKMEMDAFLADQRATLDRPWEALRSRTHNGIDDQRFDVMRSEVETSAEAGATTHTVRPGADPVADTTVGSSTAGPGTGPGARPAVIRPADTAPPPAPRPVEKPVTPRWRRKRTRIRDANAAKYIAESAKLQNDAGDPAMAGAFLRASQAVTAGRPKLAAVGAPADVKAAVDNQVSEAYTAVDAAAKAAKKGAQKVKTPAGIIKRAVIGFGVGFVMPEITWTLNEISSFSSFDFKSHLPVGFQEAIESTAQTPSPVNVLNTVQFGDSFSLLHNTPWNNWGAVSFHLPTVSLDGTVERTKLGAEVAAYTTSHALAVGRGLTAWVAEKGVQWAGTVAVMRNFYNNGPHSQSPEYKNAHGWFGSTWDFTKYWGVSGLPSDWTASFHIAPETHETTAQPRQPNQFVPLPPTAAPPAATPPSAAPPAATPPSAAPPSAAPPAATPPSAAPPAVAPPAAPPPERPSVRCNQHGAPEHRIPWPAAGANCL